MCNPNLRPSTHFWYAVYLSFNMQSKCLIFLFCKLWEGPHLSQITQDILGGGACILSLPLSLYYWCFWWWPHSDYLLWQVFYTAVSNPSMTIVTEHNRNLSLAPAVCLLSYGGWGGTCLMSPTQADEVVTIWKLLVVVAGEWVLKCFFPDELLLILHWSQQDLGSAELEEGGKLSSPSVPGNGGETDTGEQECPSYLTACLPEELPSLLIHLPPLNTVLSLLFSQSTTNTRLFCTSDF